MFEDFDVILPTFQWRIHFFPENISSFLIFSILEHYMNVLLKRISDK